MRSLWNWPHQLFVQWVWAFLAHCITEQRAKPCHCNHFNWTENYATSSWSFFPVSFNNYQKQLHGYWEEAPKLCALGHKAMAYRSKWTVTTFFQHYFRLIFWSQMSSTPGISWNSCSDCFTDWTVPKVSTSSWYYDGSCYYRMNWSQVCTFDKYCECDDKGWSERTKWEAGRSLLLGKVERVEGGWSRDVRWEARAVDLFAWGRCETGSAGEK